MFFKLIIQLPYKNLRKFRKNSKKIAIKQLAKDLENTERTMYIYSGRCENEVWKNKSIKKVLENKKDKIDVIVICENVLDKDDKVRGYLKAGLINKLKKVKDGKIFPGYHFRIKDNDKLFLEKHGVTSSMEDNYFKIISKVTLINQFKDIFYKIYKNSDEMPTISNKKVA